MARTSSTSRMSVRSDSAVMAPSLPLMGAARVRKSDSAEPEICASGDLKELSDGSEKSFTAVVAEVCAETMSEQEIAFYLAKGNQSLWSRMKAGEPGCNLKANDVFHLPADRQQRLFARLAELRGLRVQQADRKRMAVARLVQAGIDVLVELEEETA